MVWRSKLPFWPLWWQTHTKHSCVPKRGNDRTVLWRLSLLGVQLIPKNQTVKIWTQLNTQFKIDRKNGLSNFTKDLTTEAVDFIRKRSGEPFFLMFTPDASHGPVYSSEAFAHSSRRGLVGNAIRELDWSVGEIVKALDSDSKPE